MSGWALLCPGQGGQDANMFAMSQAYLQPSLAELWRALPLPALAELLPQHELLFANRYAQPLVVAASLANWQALQQCEASLPAPSVVAGYSVGELAACAVAGMISVPDCLQLAVQRAQAMDACAGEQRMAALNFTQAQPITDLLASVPNVALAIENGAGQWIVAGSALGMQQLQDKVASLQGRWQNLDVSVAAHTPLMAAAVEPFAKAMQALHWRVANTSVLAGVSAQVNWQVPAVQTALLQQLHSTIHWAACMDALVERGIRVVLEIGPGAALSKMLQARHPEVAVRSVSQFRSMQGVATWLARQLS